MGWFSRWREGRKAQQAERALAAWEDERAELEQFVAEAREFTGETDDGVSEIHINLRKDERIFLVGQGASLIEPKRAPGRYEGGYRGCRFASPRAFG